MANQAFVFAMGPSIPPWITMWLLSFAIYFACKWLTYYPSRKADVSRVRVLAYLFAWPGMNAREFFGCPTRSMPHAAEWCFAACKMAAGLGLLFGVTRLIPDRLSYGVGWCGMIGLVMTLHFGIFHLLSCLWRRAGIEARPVMDWPLLSQGVGEFWGLRWNTAFRDLAHQVLFRPLVRHMGPGIALVATYVASGLIHELVISIPARGGYGGPTIFFLLQALAVGSERSKVGRRIGLGQGRLGRLYTGLVLLPSAFFLFHPPFVNNVIVPFLGALGVV